MCVGVCSMYLSEVSPVNRGDRSRSMYETNWFIFIRDVKEEHGTISTLKERVSERGKYYTVL